MSTRFYKMTGSGNDFVILDGREEDADRWPPARIAQVCDRRRGVGADGWVMLRPEGDRGVRMLFYNADGSRAAMCGNAALCSTRLSVHLGMAAPQGMQLMTDAAVYESRCVGRSDRAELHLGHVPIPARVEAIPAAPGEHGIFLGSVGVPHLVIRVGDIEQVDLAHRGRELRFHAGTGPAGANANFVSAPAAPGEPWLIRTYERGVEGETLACGTGTVAAALALAAAGEAELPVTFKSRGGVLLSVAGRLNGSGSATEVWLCGEGRLVFEGSLTE